jgi:hypothetical protein
MIDDENFTRTFFLFQFEPELLLQGSEKIGSRIDRLGKAVIPRLSHLAPIRRPLQLEIVEAFEPGLVQHRAAGNGGPLLLIGHYVKDVRTPGLSLCGPWRLRPSEVAFCLTLAIDYNGRPD